MHPLSLAQIIGYVAFLLGASAFLQKNDRRLKLLNGSQCVFYALHFVLLGNFPAAGSLAVSAARSFLAIKTRSKWIAGLFIALNLVVGWMLAHSRFGWLPIAGGCLATTALFLMRGIPMRVVLLCSTFCWLANNILSGSIGGTMLEITIAAANLSTMWRLVQAQQPVAEKAMVATAGEGNSE